ncbi:MAG: AI-2E family transporter [Clostridia bacterium]|nr:AI-2E family transporter [Clostridia bacterium]
MNGKHRIRRWLWYFSLFAAVVVVYKTYTGLDGVVGLVGKIVDIFAPFVGGFVLAFFLYRPCKWVEERLLSIQGKVWPKLARPLALTATYLLFLGLVALLSYLVVPILIDSLTKLIGEIPNLLQNSQATVNAWIAPDGPLGWLELQERVDEIYANLADTFTNLITVENLQAAVKSVGSVATSLVNVVISLVVSIYMLHGREHLTRALQNFLSLFMRPRPLARLRQYTRRSGAIFSQYIYGALLDAVLVGTVVSIGLLIFRVPYAVLLGMMLGFLNLIPYFGAIVGCVGIAFVALLTNGLPMAIGVSIYIIVVQQVDANIIQPRIVGDSVGLRPFYVLLSITFFGGLFGFWGILLGPPLMAVLQMIVRDCYYRRQKSTAKKQADEMTE